MLKIKRKSIALALALLGFLAILSAAFFVPANAQVVSINLFRRIGNALLPVQSTNEIGTSTSRIQKIWVNALDATSVVGAGDVTGPASSTDNAITRFDSTTGKLLQNSGATIDDSGNLTATNFSGSSSGTNTGDQTSVSGTSGNTNALNSATTVVNVSSATAPSTGQVLTATSSTAATWQTPASAPTNFSDGTFYIYDNADANKRIAFEASGITTGNTRTITVPDASGTVTLLGNTSTGSGSVVLATSPTLVTPTLGVASATSINKVTLTAPATGSTLTIADGKTLTASNTLTFTGTDASSVAFGTGGTVLYSGGALGTPSSATLTNATGLPTAGLVDDAVTLAKMAAGTAGNLITYDASGNPAAVATGTSGQVLTSNGAGSAPTFQAAAGGAFYFQQKIGVYSAGAATSNADQEFRNVASFTSAYNDNSAVFTIVGPSDGYAAGGSDPIIMRYARDTNTGLYYKTHHDISFGGGVDTIYQKTRPFVAVMGSFVYVSFINYESAGTYKLYRFDAADLATETLMTISGTAPTGTTAAGQGNPIFSDGTNLFIFSNTSNTFLKYSVSGTTATYVSDTTFAFNSNNRPHWSDGTNVYSMTATLSGGYPNNDVSVKKYSLSAGTLTSTTYFQGLSQTEYYTDASAQTTAQYGGITYAGTNTINVIVYNQSQNIGTGAANRYVFHATLNPVTKP